MLDRNEGKVCDAIVRRLEEREEQERTALRWPEKENHKSPVEIAFKLRDQLYALEHTLIEPFEGHMRMEAQTERLFAPITSALKDALGKDALFELHLRLNALEGRKSAELSRVQQAIIAWVTATAPTVPPRPYPDGKGTLVGPTLVENIPLVLCRFEPPIIPGQYFQIRHTVDNSDQLRAERMKAAIDKKFPKLAAWKKDENAKSILVLEQNDIQLTNPSTVADTYLRLATAGENRPDETYLVATCIDPKWWIWPIMIDDRSYFDIAQTDERLHWEVDPSGLNDLTKAKVEASQFGG